MHGKQPLAGVVLLFVVCLAHSGNGQRITTIQLDGVQYFVSRMNPYSPELNYFLAYQYCRSLGLQLASFETREKADSITQYLSNAGYNKYDFWTSGNRLGTDMYLWMSTGLPFNATFNYMRKQNESDDPLTADVPTGSTSPQRTARESDSGSTSGCVALKSGSPAFEWDTDDCMKIKDFICEQTRCYYYNYGSIPVSSAQGRPAFTTTTTQRPAFTSSQQQPQQQIGSQRAGGGGSGGLGGILGFDFLTGMRTSSTSSSGVIGYNDLLNEARSTSGSSSTPPPPSPPAQPAAAPAADVVLPHGSADAEAEQATNGPYDSFHGVLEMLDDPAAYVDHQRARAATADEEYVSTIEPETVTIYERSLKTVH